MDYGLILPTMTARASVDAIEAAADAAEAASWSTVWTTDHLLVPQADADDYGHVFEAISTVAFLAGRRTRIRLGVSVIVVPMRNAVVLAKELATIDALSRGRLVVGVGVGWNEAEFSNVGVADIFHHRGAYLDESIRLWRHLWSGSAEPFHGRFVSLDDYVFGPLPAQGASVPIVVGGRSEAAYRRAAELADGYHGTAITSAELAERVARISTYAGAAGRAMPAISTRVNVRFPDATAPVPPKAIVGSPDEMAAQVRAFADAGATELALAFGETAADRVAASVERWHAEVEPLVHESDVRLDDH